MGENGETIEIGTVVQHPFARPPLFFFFLTARPIRIPVGLQEMMPCVNKKKGGGGVNKVRFGTFGNSSERFFNRML